MWGKRQRDEDWDGDRRDQSEDRREQRPDDPRGNGYWAEADDWGTSGARGGNGQRQGYGDADRQGFGESPWGESRRSRGDYGDGPSGGPGFGDSGREPGFGGARQADPRQADPRYGDPWQSDSGRPDPGRSDPGRDIGSGRDGGFGGEPGFGSARQVADPRLADPRQADPWQSDARPGDSRRSARDFPEAGFGQQPGYNGGRGGGFAGDQRGPDPRGGDQRGSDWREMDRRDMDRRDGGSPRGDAGGWASPEPEVLAPMFTPAAQAPSVSQPPAAAPVPSAVPALDSSGSGGPRPYGRLSIFTLAEDRVAEFDRLAEQAAEGVRANEPDTLVYVTHVVPKAPMQRIIYEIYRDHAAFEAHQRQPHIQQFEDGRRPCVVVTNIIDLRLKYAKVAPLQGAGQANGSPANGSLPNGSLSSGSRPAPGARHRGGQAPEPDGVGNWFSDRARGQQMGSRSADLDGDWAAERALDGVDRRSQDWGPSQYSGQRYRDN